jgi:glucokinase
MATPGLMLAADVGGSKVSLMLADAHDSAIVARERFATPKAAAPERLIDLVRAHAHSALQRTGRSLDEVRGVGFSAAGIVSPDGTVVRAGNLGWHDVPLQDILAKRFHVPAGVEQDASAGALGEAFRGSAAGLTSFAFLALGTGVGVGLVVDGRLVRGAHGAAGEAGDMLAHPSDAGDKRNINDVIGGRAIRERIGLSPFDLMTSDEGSELLRATKADFVDHVVQVVVAIGAIVDPAVVVFGGGTSAAGEALLGLVRPRLDKALFAPPEIRLSSLGEDAQLFGALFTAMKAAGATQ